MKAAHWLIAPVLLCGACDWRAFSDLEKDTPVVLLKRPGSFKQGFGAAVATATGEDGTTRVIVAGGAGQSPVATFQFGADEDLNNDSIDSGGCDNDPAVPGSRCGVSNQLAGMAKGRIEPGEERDLCFVLGLGLSATLPQVEGLVVRCSDTTEYTLLVPPEVDQVIADRDLNGIHQPLFVASDLDVYPALVAGSPNRGLAWFYPPGYSPANGEPTLLEAAGEAGQQFGSAVAVARLTPGLSGARVFAVAASSSSHVWLYRFDGTTATSLGCLSGPEGLGRALTSGDVTGDGVDDLIVADSSTVHIISGATLNTTTPSEACSSSLLDGAIKATCSGEDCSGSGFGAAVAVGDLDGQGAGELIVGAPNMNVRKRGGAVVVFRINGTTATQTDTLFISSAKKGDEIGSTLATARLDERSVIVAGGAGGSKAAVFFCSSLAPAGAVRCE